MQSTLYGLITWGSFFTSLHVLKQARHDLQQGQITKDELRPNRR